MCPDSDHARPRCQRWSRLSGAVIAETSASRRDQQRRRVARKVVRVLRFADAEADGPRLRLLHRPGHWQPAGKHRGAVWQPAPPAAPPRDRDLPSRWVRSAAIDDGGCVCPGVLALSSRESMCAVARWFKRAAPGRRIGRSTSAGLETPLPSADPVAFVERAATAPTCNAARVRPCRVFGRTTRTKAPRLPPDTAGHPVTGRARQSPDASLERSSGDSRWRGRRRRGLEYRRRGWCGDVWAGIGTRPRGDADRRGFGWVAAGSRPSRGVHGVAGIGDHPAVRAGQRCSERRGAVVAVAGRRQRRGERGRSGASRNIGAV